MNGSVNYMKGCDNNNIIIIHSKLCNMLIEKNFILLHFL